MKPRNILRRLICNPLDVSYSKLSIRRPCSLAKIVLTICFKLLKFLEHLQKTRFLAMNPNYDMSDYQLLYIKRKSLAKIFRKTEHLLIDLTNNILVLSPKQRLTAIDALSYNYFNEVLEKSLFRL